MPILCFFEAAHFQSWILRTTPNNILDIENLNIGNMQVYLKNRRNHSKQQIENITFPVLERKSPVPKNWCIRHPQNSKILHIQKLRVEQPQR